MRTVSAVVAVGSLVLAVVSLSVIGGAIFALFLFLPLFLLALGVVLAGLEDQTVRQHDPSMSPKAWRSRS